VLSPEAAAQEMAREIAGEGRVAILFGRERWGLTNEEVALADRIVTFPVDPEFASLNLAQAVLLMGYEWFKVARDGALPFAATDRSVRASKEQEQSFFDTLLAELDRVEFLRPVEKRDTMIVNLRNIFSRMEPTRQDMQTLHGAIKAIAEGAKGPARGGVLDSDEATRLRALLATTGAGRMPDEQGPVRGLARLLRRNTSDAERVLWKALTKDRRFAGQFKRQTPVGRQIPDFVSFPFRLAVELIAASEIAEVVQDRGERRTWLEARDYRVVEVRESDVMSDLDAVLQELEKSLTREAS
jgi:tRNA/rRNA methyltransferase